MHAQVMALPRKPTEEKTGPAKVNMTIYCTEPLVQLLDKIRGNPDPEQVWSRSELVVWVLENWLVREGHMRAEDRTTDPG